jgi:Transposase
LFCDDPFPTLRLLITQVMKNPSKQIRRTESQIRTLLNLYSKNDGTVVAFCKDHKIHKATFYNWRHKYELQIEKPAAFIPVQFDQPSLSSALFAEIEMASNITIRLYQRVDGSWLKSLVK